ncbi:hypothetical protein [Salipiger marinus]|uniref:Uncharacterized protein n=1 Tax=Salipiger marinus TaxID=555512 RepID=A0A1G8RW49_9RHOB|nr:hypothetical protein [Salipiger marinus]SDJ21241.1 hypothetical protein SAMN04487993_10225 [Salipiger marinus]
MTIGSFLTAIVTIGFALGILLVQLIEHGAFPLRIQMVDMTEHVLLFAILMLPTALFRPHWMIWLVPLACFFAIGLELVQPLEGRGHGFDVIAKGFGIILVTVIVPLIRAIGAFIASR